MSQIQSQKDKQRSRYKIKLLPLMLQITIMDSSKSLKTICLTFHPFQTCQRFCCAKNPRFKQISPGLMVSQVFPILLSASSLTTIFDSENILCAFQNMFCIWFHLTTVSFPFVRHHNSLWKAFTRRSVSLQVSLPVIGKKLFSHN